MMMRNRMYWKWLLVGLSLTLLVPLVVMASPQTQTYAITTQVTAGDGWIDTVEPSTAIPAGTTKHYRIQPARGYMIGDVGIDGVSIGPMMFATIPNVQANHTITASFTAFDQVAASNVSTKITGDTRILLIGEATSVTRIRELLDGQIRADESIDFNVAIGTQGISNDLLTVYYEGRSDGPTTRNAMLAKIHDGWDYVIPLDLYDYSALLPELHLEGVRLMYNRAWFDGGQARLILPMVWYASESATYLDEIADHTYRIANGFRIPVLPAGYAWRELVQNHGIPESSIEGMSWEAAYLFASMIFDQLFERNVATVGYSTPYVDDGDENNIEAVAWTTWQAEKTKTHYSGSYTGIASPFNGIGGRGYHFGTSTRARSVDKMNALIAVPDPDVSSLVHDSANYFGDAATAGSDVQDDLGGHPYTYMWRQWKGEDSLAVLNTYVRGQFGQDPYFIWFGRYYDQPANSQAPMIGYQAYWEAGDALADNLDTINNPNRKSRSPMTHIGWGRVWEERTDIQMMESDLAHATGPMMSMFAAQTYALITGRDASLFGTWGYDPDSDLGEKAGYAQRVGYETIMEMSTLDIQEPYDLHQYDVPVFSQYSVFYPQTDPLGVQDDTFVVEATTDMDPVVIPAPGVLANDRSAAGQSLMALLSTDLPSGQGDITLNLDGAVEYQPVMMGSPPELFLGTATFSYVAWDGTNRSKAATVTLNVRPPLRLSKGAEPGDDVRDNDTITYTLTISGAGQSAVLWDPLPPALNYVSDSLTDTLAVHAAYSSTVRAIVWEGSLAEDGAAGVIRFQVAPAIPGSGTLLPPIVNTAWLTDTWGTSLSSTVIINAYRVYLPLVTKDM
jgi:uncharacterized repeat protein (TIGR01451 family)